MNGDVERGGIVPLLLPHLASSKWSGDGARSCQQTALCGVPELVEALRYLVFFSCSVSYVMYCVARTKLSLSKVLHWGSMVRKLNQVVCGRPWSVVQNPKTWRVKISNQHLRHKTMQRVQYQGKKPLKEDLVVAQYPCRRPRRQIGSATMLLRKSKESTLEVKYLIDKWLGWIWNRHRLRFR